MIRNSIISLLCAAIFIAPGVQADTLPRFEKLEAAGEAMRGGRQVSTATWAAIPQETYSALANPRILERIDLAAIAKEFSQILARDAMLDLARGNAEDAYIDAQRCVAELLGRGADFQSGSGTSYRSAADEIVLKPLLSLANNWIAASEKLKAMGADASTPPASVFVTVEGPLNERGKAMVAAEEKRRALVPLNGRLVTINYNLPELSKLVKSTMARLKAAGKHKFFEETIAASGITQERLRQIAE